MKILVTLLFIMSIAQAFASGLSTKFFSAEARNQLINDPLCIVFFGCVGSPEDAQYCALTTNASGKNFVKFYKYDYNQKSLIAKDSVEISEELFSDLFLLLKDEALNATDSNPVPTLDGQNIELGIKNDKWIFAGTNTTNNKSLAYLMGKIGTSKTTNEIKAHLKKALEIKENASIAQKKILVAHEGYVFSDIPSLRPTICQTNDAIWIIKAVTKGKSDSKIILFRLSKDFNESEEFEISIPQSQYSVPQNLCALSDSTILFSNYDNGKASIYKYDTLSKKVEKICSNLSSDNLQIFPIDAEKFAVLSQPSESACIAIYSINGKELYSYKEKLEDKSERFGFFSNLIPIDNEEFAVCYTRQTANKENDKACCVMEKVATMTFESSIYVFTSDLKLKQKSDFVKGKAEDCFESEGKLYLLVQDGTMATMKASMNLYSYFLGKLAKVAEVSDLAFSPIIHSAISEDCAFFISPFSLHSLDGNTGIFFAKSVLSVKKMPREFDHIDGIACDDKNLFLLTSDFSSKHKRTIFKTALKNIL